MLPKRTVTEYVKEYALIILGSAIYGVGFEFFFYPNEVLAGGLTGVAMIINMLTDLPVGVMNIVMNIPLFIAAWRRFGLGFVIGSFTGMAASSVFIDLFSLLHCSLRSSAGCSTGSGWALSTVPASRPAAWISS